MLYDSFVRAPPLRARLAACVVNGLASSSWKAEVDHPIPWRADVMALTDRLYNIKQRSVPQFVQHRSSAGPGGASRQVGVPLGGAGSVSRQASASPRSRHRFGRGKPRLSNGRLARQEALCHQRNGRSRGLGGLGRGIHNCAHTRAHADTQILPAAQRFGSGGRGSGVACGPYQA